MLNMEHLREYEIKQSEETLEKFNKWIKRNQEELNKLYNQVNSAPDDKNWSLYVAERTKDIENNIWEKISILEELDDTIKFIRRHKEEIYSSYNKLIHRFYNDLYNNKGEESHE